MECRKLLSSSNADSELKSISPPILEHSSLSSLARPHRGTRSSSLLSMLLLVELAISDMNLTSHHHICDTIFHHRTRGCFCTSLFRDILGYTHAGATKKTAALIRGCTSRRLVWTTSRELWMAYFVKDHRLVAPHLPLFSETVPLTGQINRTVAGVQLFGSDCTIIW